MRQQPALWLLAASASLLAACNSAESPDAASMPEPAAEAPPPGPAYNPVASIAVLMRGTVSMAAEDYWSPVSIVIDADGEHINQPETEAEWERVWAAGITLAETGNLLLMPPRALDDPDWERLSLAMVDVGLEAARAADAQDYEAVLTEGEKIYNLCNDCHAIFMPTLRL